MATAVRSILKSLEQKSMLDIVSFINYPYYDWMFSKTKQKFHIYSGDRMPVEWLDEVLKKPNNVCVDIRPDLPLNLDANLILCHNKTIQFDLAKIFSNFWHLPVAMVHQLGPRDAKFHHQWQIIANRVGHINIFLSKEIQEQWERPGYIIEPGIPVINLDKNKQKEISHIICSNEDRKIVRNVLGDVSFIRGGDFSKCLIMVNTSTTFYPIHALVAMGAGCCLITQKIPELDYFLKHEENAIVCDDIASIKRAIDTYKNRPSKCFEIGERAKETVKDKFSVDNFIKKMNIALKHTAETVYTR